MKKLIILSLAVAAMAGCQKDDNLGSSQSGNVVNFSSESLSTRVNSITQEWESGDRVGIFMYNQNWTSYTYSNIEYTTTPNSDASTAVFSAVTSSEAIKYPNGEDVTFSAYYPYDSELALGDGTEDSYTTIDIADQSDLGAIDFMVAGDKSVAWSSTSTSTPVAFSFEHKLTKLVFNVETQYSIEDISDLQVLINGDIKSEVKYNLKGEEIEVLSSVSDEWIDLYVEHDADDKSKATVTAILHPSSSAVNIELMLAYDYSTYLDEDPPRYLAIVNLMQSSLVAGYQYVYTTSIGEDNATFTGDTQITPWEDGVPTSSSLDASTKSYAISSAEDLMKIGSEYPLDATYELVDDIELSLDDEWIPIGGIDMMTMTFSGFSGTFNGNNHTISGLNISSNVIGEGMVFFQGLFGYVTASGLVRDVNVEGKIEFTGDVDPDNLDDSGTQTEIGNVAGVVGYNVGTVDNCTSKMDILLNNCYWVCSVGGVVGLNQAGTVTNCTSYNASLELKNNSYLENVAGVVAVNFSGTVENCRNEFNFDLTSGNWEQRDSDPVNSTNTPIRLSMLAGVVSQSEMGTISGCSNVGDILLGDICCNTIGGVIGCDDDCYGVVVDCYNSGDIKGDYIQDCGGIVGSVSSEGYSISNCYNVSSQISGYAYIGGIIGSIGSNGSSIINCYNQSEIQGCQYIGGVIGEYFVSTDAIQPSSIVNCGTSGNIVGAETIYRGYTYSSMFIGGLTGLLRYNNELYPLTITACYSASSPSGNTSSSDIFAGSIYEILQGSDQFSSTTNLIITDCYVSQETGIDATYYGDDTIETVADMVTNSFVSSLNGAASTYNSSLSSGDIKACSWKLAGDGLPPILNFYDYPSSLN